MIGPLTIGNEQYGWGEFLDMFWIFFIFRHVWLSARFKKTTFTIRIICVCCKQMIYPCFNIYYSIGWWIIVKKTFVEAAGSSCFCLSPAQTTKFSLKSFDLTSFISLCVQHKLTSFSLTRSLVQKLFMPAFEQGKLFVCTAGKENLTNTCN